MPISHHTNQPLCQSATMPNSHHAYQPSCLSAIMPISHHAYQPSCLSAIIPIGHLTYQLSCLSAIVPIDYYACQPSCLSSTRNPRLWNCSPSFPVLFVTFKLFSLSDKEIIKILTKICLFLEVIKVLLTLIITWCPVKGSNSNLKWNTYWNL